MSKETLHALIDEKIYENLEGDIGGENLNEILNDIVDEMPDANPEGEATETLEKIQIGDTVYGIPQETVDQTPTQGHTNPVSSGGVYTALQGKQDNIDSSHKLSADLVQDGSTNKVVTQTEKNTWNAKQNALTFDNEPTANSNNPVKSGGVKTALDAKAPSTNIAKSALASDVQTSLGKADSAIQSVEVNGNPVPTDQNKAVNISIPQMTGASASAAGSAGLVPAPAAGDEDKVLKGDGTWADERDIVSANATQVPYTQNASATIDQNRILQLEIPQGTPGHNPNLGTFLDTDSANWPSTNIQDGDFIVVVHTDVTPRTSTMYTWNGSAWTDTLRDAGATFASGEVVSNVNIINDLTTGGVNDVLSAEQGMVAGAGWQKISYSENTPGYLNSSGSISGTSSTTIHVESYSVSENQVILILTKLAAADTMCWFYDSNGTKIKNSVIKGIVSSVSFGFAIVPHNAVTMKISCMNNFTSVVKVSNGISLFQMNDVTNVLTIEELVENDYFSDAIRKLNSIFITGFENSPSYTDEGTCYIGFNSGNKSGSTSGTQMFSYPVQAGQVFLIDCYSLSSSAATIAFYNSSTIGSDSYMSDFSIAGSGVDEHLFIIVPKDAVLICISFNPSASHAFRVRKSVTGIPLDKYIDLSVVDELSLQVSSMQNDVDKGVAVYNNLQYDYYEIGEPIEPSTTATNLYIARDRELVSPGNSVWRIYAFTPSEQDRWLRIKQYVYTSSVSVGGAFLVDNTNELVAGTTIPESDILIGANSSTPKTIDKSVFVPAGRILCVSHSTYSTQNYCNVYNTVFGSGVINDMQNDIQELQDNIDETVENIIDGKLGVDAIPDVENPLAVIKETAGYTAIFRTMGVIGGSMSTGFHSYTTGSVSSNMPQFSSLQFMARLCGATGYNFSRGGISAHSWPQNDMIDSFDNNHLCQMYLIQLGNNDLAYHETHPDYTLGTTADLPGNNGVWTDTFYGNMGRILNSIRTLQPRAYVFLSTFLARYGTVPIDFDYNQAIRNIVEYYTANNGANRPEGDELHYYLIDIYNFGEPYTYYQSGIHTGTTRGSHLVATGYLHWAYEYCTYIDWIIKNNMSDFNDVAFVGTDDYYE